MITYETEKVKKNMNKKRILILLILFTTVIGFTLSNVSAVEGAKLYKTNIIKIKDRNYPSFDKNLGTDDSLQVYYWSKMSKREGQLFISIFGRYDIEDSGKYKLSKAKVKFVKKVSGKNKYILKWFKGGKYNSIVYNPKNGYKPYKAVVYYYKK